MDEKRKKALEDADRVIKDHEGKRFNGWSNFDTWQARNLIEEHKEIFNEVLEDLNFKTLEWAVHTSLSKSGLGSDHVMFHLVNWKELENHYIKMKEKKDRGEF